MRLLRVFACLQLRFPTRSSDPNLLPYLAFFITPDLRLWFPPMRGALLPSIMQTHETLYVPQPSAHSRLHLPLSPRENHNKLPCTWTFLGKVSNSIHHQSEQTCVFPDGTDNAKQRGAVQEKLFSTRYDIAHLRSLNVSPRPCLKFSSFVLALDQCSCKRRRLIPTRSFGPLPVRRDTQKLNLRIRIRNNPKQPPLQEYAKQINYSVFVTEPDNP